MRTYHWQRGRAHQRTPREHSGPFVISNHTLLHTHSTDENICYIAPLRFCVLSANRLVDVGEQAKIQLQSKDKAVPGLNERTVAVQGTLLQVTMGVTEVSLFVSAFHNFGCWGMLGMLVNIFVSRSVRSWSSPPALPPSPRPSFPSPHPSRSCCMEPL